MARLTFTSTLCFLFIVVGFGQEAANKLQGLTTEHYREDYKELTNALKQTYPSLYRFSDKQAVDRLMDSCYASIDQGTNPTSFYATIKYVLSALKDGHLSSTASLKLRNTFEAQPYFPLSLLFLQQGVYNYCDHPLIPKGAQIFAINGVAMKTIREKLYSYLVSDGSIKTSKDWTLNSVFWFYYYLIYGVQQSFTVDYSMPNGTTNTGSLNAEKRSSFSCSPYEFSQTGDVLDLSFPEKNVAVLTIKTFSRQVLTEAGKDFDSFLKSSFQAIGQKGINRLIIDLRGNGGGADIYGAHLYGYLTGKPFSYYRELETKERKLTSKDHPNLDIQRPSKDHYSEEVLILINGLTFSAAAEFCSIAKTGKRGTFIGEETGGGYYGNTSGGFIETVLPNTGIVISIPTTKYVMAVGEGKQKDRGIIPDYIIAPSIDNILQGDDVQMKHALKFTAANTSFVK